VLIFEGFAIPAMFWGATLAKSWGYKERVCSKALRFQVHSPEKVAIAGVGVNGVVNREMICWDEKPVLLIDCFLKPFQGFIFIPEVVVYPWKS
jgi:hypothetical protein